MITTDATLSEVIENALRAATRAPSVHNTQPWVLELPDEGRAELYERLDRTLPRHDPLGRDRLISCGAALTHVLLAMRVLGWVPETTLFPEPDLDRRGRRASDSRPRRTRRAREGGQPQRTRAAWRPRLPA
jgi:nitroreductase